MTTATMTAPERWLAMVPEGYREGIVGLFWHEGWLLGSDGHVLIAEPSDQQRDLPPPPSPTYSTAWLMPTTEARSTTPFAELRSWAGVAVWPRLAPCAECADNDDPEWECWNCSGDGEEWDGPAIDPQRIGAGWFDRAKIARALDVVPDGATVTLYVEPAGKMDGWPIFRLLGITESMRFLVMCLHPNRDWENYGKVPA